MILMVSLGSAPLKRITGSFKALDKDDNLFSRKRISMAGVCMCVDGSCVCVCMCVHTYVPGCFSLVYLGFFFFLSLGF